jgi:hypothetical protein
MNIRSIQKIGGVSLILGSFLLAVYTTAFIFTITLKITPNSAAAMIQNPNWLWLACTVFIGIICLLFGFVAVYSKLYDKTGASGLLGFIFIQFAYLLQAAKVTWEICLYPVIVNNEKSAFLFTDNILKSSFMFSVFRITASTAILVGIILFCTAIFRSKVFPKAGGLLVFCGALLYGLGPLFNVYIAMAGIFIFAAGCFILGKKLITD